MRRRWPRAANLLLTLCVTLHLFVPTLALAMLQPALPGTVLPGDKVLPVGPSVPGMQPAATPVSTQAAPWRDDGNTWVPAPAFSRPDASLVAAKSLSSPLDATELSVPLDAWTGPLPRQDVYPVVISMAQQMQAEAARASDTPEQDYITAEIQSLARVLDNDPLLIYQYVAERIELVLSYGLTKAPEETLLCGIGSPMDQGALLVALLRSAGYEARYQFGIPILSFEQAQAWTGTSDAETAAEVLSNGGFNVNVGNNYIALGHLWTEVKVGGTWHPLDPAFRRFERTAGINLAPALGYDRTLFLNAALEGATVTSKYAKDIHSANIDSRLALYAKNLISYLDQNAPFSSPAEVAGRGQMVAEQLTELPDELPYMTEGGEVPVDHVLTLLKYVLAVAFDDVRYAVTMDEASGKRLTLFFEPHTASDRTRIETAGGIYGVDPAYEVHMVPVLRLAGQEVARGSSIMLGARLPISVTMYAPWRTSMAELYAGLRAEDELVAGGAYAMVPRMQATSSGQIDRHQRLLVEARAQWGDSEAEPVLGQALELMGLSYYHQLILAKEIVAEAADVRFTKHFGLGWFFQGVSVEWEEVDGYWVPARLSPGAPRVDIIGHDRYASPDGSLPAQHAVRTAGLCISSALEHGVIEQTQGLESISTVRIMHWVDVSGLRVYRVTSDTLYALLPQLQLPDSDKDVLSDLVAEGHEVLVPEARVSVNEWSGVAFISRTADGVPAGWSISGGLQGGGGTRPRKVQLDRLMPDLWRVPLAGPSDDPNMTEVTNPRHVADPVDPATGALLHSEGDLSFGSLGLPITMRRSYASSRQSIDGPLGPGWTHTYNMRALPSTDWSRSLGQGTAVDAAAAVVYAYVASDIAWMDAANLPWERILIASEMSQWLMSELTNNAVLLTDHRGSTHSYLRLPDGSYRAGPTIYSELGERTGGGYDLDGKDGSRLIFDQAGNLSQLADVNGNRTELTYDALGNLVQLADPANRRLTLSYASGRLTTVTDPANRQYRYAYDGQGRLATFQDPAGDTTRYTYGANGRLKSTTDPEGQTYVSCGYDDAGRVITQTNGLDGEVTFRYGGGRTVVTDANGQTRVYQYDSRNRLIALEDGLGQKRAMVYDGNGNPLSMTNELGHTTQFTFDSRGNLTEVTGPLGQKETYTYSAADNLVRVTDALGHSWSYQYDGGHHVTRSTDPLGNATRYTYSSTGLLTAMTDANGNTTTLSYDAAGDLVQIKSPLGARTDLSYDQLSRLTTVTEPNGGVTHFSYDLGSRLVSVTDPAGGTTRASYDGNGSLVQLTDALGAATSYAYDAQLNLVSVTDPLGQARRLDYDLRGQVIRQTKPDGQSITYHYDAAGRLIRGEYPDGDQVRFAYDAAGNLMEGSRGNWVERREVNAAGKVTKITYPQWNLALSLTYDAAGNRSLLTASRAGLSLLQCSYAYDDAGRLTQVQDVTSGGSTRLQYDASGRLIALTQPSGARNTYAYDADGRMTTAEALDGAGSSIVRWQHAYDAAGNPIQASETRGGRTTSVAYAYDVRGQLIQTTHSRYGVTYSYDAAGNRTQTQDPRGTTLYSYDAAGRLLSAGSRSFAYDANGNRLSETSGGLTLTYAWDAEDRLTALTMGDGTAYAYWYDALGRLGASSEPGAARQLVYDGWHALLESTDGFASGVANTSAAGRLTGRRSFGTGAVPESAFHADGLGHVRLLTDRLGLPRDVYPHDAFGYPGRAAGLDPNPYRFAGEWGAELLGASAGLYRMGFRIYDSSVGRFLSPDPVVGVLGEPLTVNAYLYALNSPLRYLDPAGLRPIGEVRVERASQRLTDAIVAWAAVPGRQGYDPVEYGLRLVFYRQAALQRIRDLQLRLANIGRREVPSKEGAPGYAPPQDLPKLRLAESIDVLESVVRKITGLLEGQTWR